MELDAEKIDQAVLALLSLGMHQGSRVWKSFDWEVMGRLHAQGYISDPIGRPKSVVFTEEGLSRVATPAAGFIWSGAGLTQAVRRLGKRCDGGRL
jgi:hypothetical protein